MLKGNNLRGAQLGFVILTLHPFTFSMIALVVRQLAIKITASVYGSRGEVE